MLANHCKHPLKMLVVSTEVRDDQGWFRTVHIIRKDSCISYKWPYEGSVASTSLYCSYGTIILLIKGTYSIIPLLKGTYGIIPLIKGTYGKCSNAVIQNEVERGHVLSGC